MTGALPFGGNVNTTLKLANIAVWMHKDEFMKGMNEPKDY
jgi:hypothetical protein